MTTLWITISIGIISVVFIGLCSVCYELNNIVHSHEKTIRRHENEIGHLLNAAKFLLKDDETT